MEVSTTKVFLREYELHFNILIELEISREKYKSAPVPDLKEFPIRWGWDAHMR